MATDDQRFAPPLAHVEDVALSGSGTLAGRGARLLAVLIDGLISGVLFWVLTLFTPLTLTPAAGASLTRVLLVNFVIGFILFLVLQGFLLATRGQTIGKALLKMRIVRSDGSPASFGRLVGMRYLPTTLLSIIPILGGLYAIVDSLLIFRESRRCLHDNIADTIVVKA